MELTTEQLRVINHPAGRHARVLAVAGSGKTTTMVQRVLHLITERGASPDRVLVVMFNTMARHDFIRKLDERQVPTARRPQVHTYHSFASGMIRVAERNNLLRGPLQFWVGQEGFHETIAIRDAIREVTAAHRMRARAEGEGRTYVPDIDLAEAGRAIGLWKGGLIPPERAGYRGDPRIIEVYAAYEQRRTERMGVTFDDFVPIAVEVLRRHPEARARIGGTFSHIIVDEYQDVNLGQQEMIELVASPATEFMVVGDDDQTIYEWRGARPGYILTDCQARLTDLPWETYELRRTFRFGRSLAEVVARVIGRNVLRHPKELVAHDEELAGQVELIRDTATDLHDSDDVMADQVEALLANGVAPSEIVVLGRMYAQMARMEIQLFRRKIPYRVLDQVPFFERREVKTLLAFLHLALSYRAPVNELAEGWLLSAASLPSVYVPVGRLRQWAAASRERESTVFQALGDLIGLEGIPNVAVERATQLAACIREMHERLEGLRAPTASALLQIVVERVKYLDAFENAWGEGEEALDKRLAVEEFLDFAAELGCSAVRLLSLVENADTKRGVPEREQIRLATVFKTKGLEFDYVFVPRVDETIMPMLHGRDPDVFDLATGMSVLHDGDRVESERRLFYVALTRARVCAFVGTSVEARLTPSLVRRAPRPSRFVAELGIVDAPRENLPSAKVRPASRGIDAPFRLHHVSDHAGHTSADELPGRDRIARHFRSIVVAVDSVAGTCAGFVCGALPNGATLVATSTSSFGMARHVRVSWFGSDRHLGRVAYCEPRLDLAIVVVHAETKPVADLAERIPDAGHEVTGFGIHPSDVLNPGEPMAHPGVAEALFRGADADAVRSSVVASSRMSGGPLVDDKGSVVAMMSEGFTAGGAIGEAPDTTAGALAVPARFIQEAVAIVIAESV
jgi:DNA helicase-2/ATP-dependent DNA helicase PcrA